MLNRPNGPNGEKKGVSRTKISSLLLGLWGVGATVAHVPENIVVAGSTVLGALVGIFLRDAK